MSELEPGSKPRLNAMLVYDGECGFCRRYVRWVRRRLPRQPRIEPWQELDLDRWGLTARQCHDAVQWVEPGRIEPGARAIGRLLLAQRGAWRLLGWPPFVWPFSAAADGLYDWVARNRHRFKGDDVPGDTAPDGDASGDTAPGDDTRGDDTRGDDTRGDET